MGLDAWFAFKAAFVWRKKANSVALFEILDFTANASDIAGGFMTNSERLRVYNEALGIWFEVHDIAMAQRGTGDLDEDFVWLGGGNGNLVEVQLIILWVVSSPHQPLQPYMKLQRLYCCAIMVFLVGL